MNITPHTPSSRRRRLPAVLAFDYVRHAAWPYVLAALSLTVLTGVAGGVVTASELLGW